jgi:hypothetical protein
MGHLRVFLKASAAQAVRPAQIVTAMATTVAGPPQRPITADAQRKTINRTALRLRGNGIPAIKPAPAMAKR